MQTAERNVDEMLGELHLQCHQTRQTAITGEILDVVSGFEALTHRRGSASGRREARDRPENLG